MKTNIIFMLEGCIARQASSRGEFSVKKGFRALLAKLSRNYDISVNFISSKPQDDAEWEVDESGISSICEIENVIGKSEILREVADALSEAIGNHPEKETLFVAYEANDILALEAGIDFLPATEETFRQLYDELGKR